MCYRDNIPAIDFTGVHTACISGNNGNGKSALIDAMTWALWGQTRASSDDDLIHSGQAEVEVEFEFAVGDQRYRIIRKHSKPKTSKSSGATILEFQIITPEGNKVISGDTTSQTQQKIIQVLHMDYDTFINSAFLRQGRADEFTKKRPGERKQVLANILQLSVYDGLESQAKEIAKEHDNLITQIESVINSLQEDLLHQPEYQAEFEQARNQISETDQLLQEQEERLNSLRKEKVSQENKKTQLEEINRHIQDTERNYKLWYDQSQQCRLHIEAFQYLIAQRVVIEAQYQRFTDTRKLYQELEQKLKQYNILLQGKHRLEMVILKAGGDLTKTHAVTENRILDLELVFQKLPRLQEESQQILGHLQQLTESDNKLAAKRENSQLLHARVHFLQAEKIQLIQEINQIEDKLKMLSHQEGVTCPLCDTELGHDGQKRIESRYLVEKSGKAEVLKNCLAELGQKETEARALENEILQLDVKLKQARETVQSRYGNISQAIADAREAGAKIENEKKVLSEIEARLALRDFAVNEQTSLTRIEKEMESLNYDHKQHESVKSQLAELEIYESPKRQLEEADRLIPQEKENEEKACKTAEELRLKLENDKQRREILIFELNAFNRLAGELKAAEDEYQNLLVRQKKIRETLGAAKAKLQRMAEAELKKKEKESQLAHAAQQENIYQDLAQAFGKKGIQAMLIEMAIPEIEAEANKLLSRMTDNRMHIKMETQKETKKGDVQETLDINISDELGTRNYEMFSGGEAFRIDFAIRIALSKLLARRAGAPLPTLIVDEGFGTQDISGIEKIKEAITSIQDDFEKILVITHINDFKEAFPLRIEVSKTLEGSTVSLN